MPRRWMPHSPHPWHSSELPHGLSPHLHTGLVASPALGMRLRSQHMGAEGGAVAAERVAETLKIEKERVPPPRQKCADRNSELTEIYLRF